MKKVLIIEYMDRIRDMTVLALDNLPLKTLLYNCFTVKEGIELLREKEDISLIICDYEKEFENASKILAYLRDNEIQIPVLVYSNENWANIEGLADFKQLNPRNVWFKYDSSQREFEEILVDFLSEAESRDMFDFQEKDFERVRILYFLRFNESLCDVYLRLSKDKYVKIINKGDPYTKAFIEKFTDKKVRYLYIKRDQYEKFCVSVLQTPFLIFNEDHDQDAEKVCSSTVEVIQGLVGSIGISPVVIKLVDKVAETIGRELGRTDLLGDLLKKMREKRNYLYDHSYLVAYVAWAICLEMDWDSEATRRKLIMAAILHDLGVEDPDMALAVELGLPEMHDYTDSEIEIFKKHPVENANLIRKSSRMPPNIDDIVENHHETPRMDGFPRGLNATSITKISGVFNLAHFFVNELYLCGFKKKQIPRILKKIQVDYDKGNYRSAVKGLLKAVKKKKKKF